MLIPSNLKALPAPWQRKENCCVCDPPPHANAHRTHLTQLSSGHSTDESLILNGPQKVINQAWHPSSSKITTNWLERRPLCLSRSFSKLRRTTSRLLKSLTITQSGARMCRAMTHYCPGCRNSTCGATKLTVDGERRYCALGDQPGDDEWRDWEGNQTASMYVPLLCGVADVAFRSP